MEMHPMTPTNIEFIDRPDLTWIFADSVTSVILEHRAICRIEFCAVRWGDQPPASAPASGRQYPVCRLAMPLRTMIDIHKRLGHILSQLEQEGAFERVESSTQPKAIN
jgi:hypothetical protein